MKWIVALALLPQLLAAQGERPKIARGADPNDWEAYYDAGVEELFRDVTAAEAAFVYASRLRPDRAEPLYARWIVFWARDIMKFRDYLTGEETVLREPAVVQAESLRVRALHRNPFVHQGLVMYLYDRLPGRFRDDPLTRSWISLGRGELSRALSSFAVLLEKDVRKYGYLRFIRASAFVNSAKSDSALAEITALLAQLRAQDADFLTNQYQSKELLEYASGLLYLQMGRPAAAREAFGRAVVENASFAPAHAMLGRMVTSSRNAESAVTDLKFAQDLDPLNVEHVLGYGRALILAKQPQEAVTAFRKAVEMEPLYAMPYLALANALEVSRDTTGAVAEYRKFLERSPANEPQRMLAERKLKELGVTQAGSPRPD